MGSTNTPWSSTRNALSTLLLLPYAFFIFHRSSDRPPPLTFSILCRFFLLALFGTCSGQIFGYIGIDYSSPTLGTPPCLTSSLLSLSYLLSFSGWKMCTGEGPPIICQAHPINSFLTTTTFKLDSWRPFLAADSSSSYGTFCRHRSLKSYPAVVFVVFFQCFFATIQSAVFTLIEVKDATAWKLRPDMGMMLFYTLELFQTVIRYSLISWCC
ncbi:hypothetical protein M0R45_022785 [Rubus argutus]|uniref:WAT1-related protein n=1 Tax=Rubus argutus TaxID=59490 RepID=A0AAW1XHI1_RUBAR